MAGPTYKMRPEVARYLQSGVTYDPLRQPIYDSARFTATIAAGTTTSFFQTPVGQASGAALNGVTKSELDTNMRLAGQIPAQHVFECWSPRVYVSFDLYDSATAPAVNQHIDVITQTINNAFIRLRIVSQEKLLVPVWYLPGGAGVAGQVVQGFQAAAANFQSLIATNGEPNQFSAQRLDPFPIVIPPLQQFTFDFVNPIAITLAAAVTALRIQVLLDGILHRPALP